MFNDKFPGNDFVLKKMAEALVNADVVAVTGAGTSAPDVPTWGSLLKRLIVSAEQEGMIDKNLEKTLTDEDDYLYVADELYRAMGASTVKARVCQLASSLKTARPSHELLVQIPFSKYLTLNYDTGLEIAFSNIHRKHVLPITTANETEYNLWTRSRSTRENILHWHGIHSNSQAIVFSSSDYHDFYVKSSNNSDSLKNFFRTQTAFFVGFGFGDPFFERQLNLTMYDLPTENMHFAIIGVQDTDRIDVQKERRKYSVKYKCEILFYPVISEGGENNHAHLSEALQALLKLSEKKDKAADLPAVSNPIGSDSTDPDVSFKQSLFVYGDKQILCKPNLWLKRGGPDAGATEKSTVEEIASSKNHSAIQAPREYGLSTLGKQIAYEVVLAGGKAIVRDAETISNYRKKLLQDAELVSLSRADNAVLVIDRFSPVDQSRMIKEIISTFPKLRLVTLIPSSFHGVETENELPDMKFDQYKLEAFSRANVREVVNTLSESRDVDFVSSIVEKIYDDLLQLCIPLTPSNVIIYASVLCKDGTFSPVSRLHIIDRFITEALGRASDAYADTFNSINKSDLISEFSYSLFANDRYSFSSRDWRQYCDDYKKNKLVEFDENDIISDLLSGRIIYKEGGEYFFRYSMFFTYFVGRHISSDAEVLRECLASNKHLELGGLVEVLCGLLNDCSGVLDDLSSRFDSALNEFYNRYPIAGLDLHKEAVWTRHTREDQFWEAVNERLESGPASTEELDELKTSITAEQRTKDQKVSILRFIASEMNVVRVGYSLQKGLESAKSASASSKKAAAEGLLKGQRLAYEVATVFAPLIADKKYVSWNGFAYINLLQGAKSSDDADSEDLASGTAMVVMALPTSMSNNLCDSIGSKKLGRVFTELSNDEDKNKEKIRLLFLFALLIRSKPKGWIDSCKNILSQFKKEDYYLRNMINVAFHQYRSEVNTAAERAEIKLMIAAIRLKRERNVDHASKTVLANVVAKLEEAGHFTE